MEADELRAFRARSDNDLKDEAIFGGAKILESRARHDG